MNVLVIGGSGNLGREVVRQLSRTEHTTYSIDVSPPLDANARPDTIANVEYELIDICCIDQLRRFVALNKINKIFHLAEVATIDPMFMENMWRVNIFGASNVLKICSYYDVHCIMGVWANPSPFMSINTFETNPIITSLIWREQLINYYNKGNTVITPVRIPRLIDFDLPATQWGSYCSRFMNYVLMNSPLISDDDEYSSSSYITWMSINNAASNLISYLSLRSRNSQDMSGSYNASIQTVIQHLLDICDIESVDIVFQKLKPITISRVYGEVEKDTFIYQCLKEEVDAFRRRTS